MKKFFKIATIALLIVVMVVTLAACGSKKKNTDGNKDTDTGNNLTPASITKLKAIEDYGQTKYINASAVTYSNTSEQETKLTNRITKKNQEITDHPEKDYSSPTKIFANSQASEIIARMSRAALSYEKMVKTVDYLAGDENVDITDAVLDARVNQVSELSAKFENTPDTWSFFDDWDYYKKLKDKSDALENDVNASDEVKNHAADNVKRQDRNMMRKIFALGLDGAEFGRLATYELEYATRVVEGMAGGATISTSSSISSFDNYCMESLDYETCVYLRAFNTYYELNGSGNGLANCVRLYGYYYEYNRTSYNSQSDEDFEKQLSYGHMKTFTDEQWLDYVRIQRSSYVNAYRYTDEFYSAFYQRHFEFQDKVETNEKVIYGLNDWQSTSYTAEMRKATQNNGLKGQLTLSDWVWCYGGDNNAMKSYNAANTAYENGKDETEKLNGNGTSDAEYAGKFQFEMEQLKVVDYIMHKDSAGKMDHMNATELGQALYFEVYSYSGELVKAAQEYRKDKVLLAAGKKGADEFEYAHFPSSITDAEAQKEYVSGKVDAILTQMAATYKAQNVSSKATGAASQPWAKMDDEIVAAMTHNYSGTNKEKVEALEDMVIKRKWTCGADIDDPVCQNSENVKGGQNLGHIGEKKEYDTSHNISQFANNYQVIIRYMVGKSEISFKRLSDGAKYSISSFDDVTINAGYNSGLTADNLPDVSSYIESKTINVDSGKTFSSEISGEDKTWWTGKGTSIDGSAPAKASYSATETNNSNQNKSFTYTYTFAGWYLDTNLQYAFDPADKIGCDLTLYAGYNVTKKAK